MKRNLFASILITMFAVVLIANVGLASPAPQADAKKPAAAAAASDLVDLNSASKDQLDALPGIGEKYSQKIIPQATYNKIKDQVIAKQK